MTFIVIVANSGRALPFLRRILLRVINGAERRDLFIRVQIPIGIMTVVDSGNEMGEHLPI